MNELHFGMLGMFVKRYIFTGAVWKNRSSASAADMNSTVLLSAGDRGGPKEHQKAKEALT